MGTDVVRMKLPEPPCAAVTGFCLTIRFHDPVNLCSLLRSYTQASLRCESFLPGISTGQGGVTREGAADNVPSLLLA